MWRVGRASTAAAAVARGRAVPAPGMVTAAAGWWRRRRLNSASAGGGGDGGLFLPGRPRCRALHHSAPLCGSRNLLRKFLHKKKKKFWYDSPTLGSFLVQKPSNWNSALKLPPSKVRKEDSIRKRTLDVLLFKAVRDVLSTCDAGEDLYNLNVELSKGSLAPDFTTCRIYWKTTGNTEQDDHIDKVLQQRAPCIRHLLISNQVIGNVPPIVFVRDKMDVAVQEIERLLAIADFGPAEEENELDQNDFSKQGSGKADVSMDTSDPPMLSNLFGIDHEELNKQILEYKKMRKDKKIEGIGLTQQQQEQLAEIQKQKKLRRKKTRKASDDLTPEKYLMDKYDEDYWDNEDKSCQESELEYQLQEIDNELEADSRNTKLK
ncbi:PREDICTED: putative ribosome-binding factor A, mitochondrial [Gekko japonicus]|uniref:Ribosome-binding factor A, mitochondrial n=1 Tax=Gekko japonicus TaxID=146911 RepID=A0ABM1K2L9_GEKJA|nr:PREDICTED: putative ribosome-binding factor A, mitochondrial [Gekko japonicus]